MQNFALFVLVLALVGVIKWFNRPKKTPPTRRGVTPTDTGTPWKEKWDQILPWLKKRDWKKAGIWIGGLVLINYAFYLGFPEKWVSISVSRFFIPTHMFIIVVILFFTNSEVVKGQKVTTIHPLGKAILFILGIGILFAIWDSSKENKDSRSARYSSGRYQSKKISTNPALPINPEGEKLVREAFNFLPPDQIEEMVRICQRESGCNQFETDGKTPLHGRINPDDIGRMQNNRKWWEKEMYMYGTPEMKSWDINTSEGNLKIAVYLRKKYGTAPWSATNDFRDAFISGTYIRGAPVGEWSEKVPFNGRVSTIWYSGDVRLRDERGRIFESGPNYKMFELGKVQTLEFMSREETPVTVSIIFK